MSDGRRRAHEASSSVPRTLIAVVTVFARARGGGSRDGQSRRPGHSTGACADADAAAAGWQCATYKAPRITAIRAGASSRSRSRASRLRTRQTRRCAVRQLRRSGRRRRRHHAGDRRRPVRRGQRPVRHRGLRPARRRARARRRSTARSTRRPQGIYSEPFTTPENLDRRALLAKDRRYVKRCVRSTRPMLPYVATANVARDMDRSARRWASKKLNYFGFSYGTFLGATYAALFPHSYRAMVLDGPVDAERVHQHADRGPARAVGGFERALGRFFQACAANQAACRASAATTRGRPSTRSSTRPTRTRSRRRHSDGPAAGQRRRHPRRRRS